MRCANQSGFLFNAEVPETGKLQTRRSRGDHAPLILDAWERGQLGVTRLGGPETPSHKGSFAPIGPGTVPRESYTTQSRFGSFT